MCVCVTYRRRSRGRAREAVRSVVGDVGRTERRQLHDQLSGADRPRSAVHHVETQRTHQSR